MVKTHLLQRLSTLMLVMGLLVVSAAFGPSGQALAQTVPGGEPPTSPVAEGAPPVPETPLPVASGEPVTVVLDLENGTTIHISLPIPPGNGAAPRITISVSPRTMGNVTNRNGVPITPGRVVVDLPSAAVVNSAPPLPSDLRLLGDIIRVVMYDADGNPVDRPNFNPPVVLCFDPTPEQEAEAGGLAALRIYTFDDLTGQWTALPSSVINDQVCATVTHLSLFAITATATTDVPLPSALPTTSAADGVRLDLWFGLGLVLLVLGGVAHRVIPNSIADSR